MPQISSVCVYCASSNNMSDSHVNAAQNLGETLAQENIRMVFGGGRVGLMGVTAAAAMAHNGTVIGYIPEHLHDREIGYTDITKLHVVNNMHTRKRKMFEQSDAFIIMSGGLGTLEELFEVLTWRQIGLHNKPIIIVNIDGFWNPLLAIIDHVIHEKAARPSARDLFIVVNYVDEIITTILEAENEH